MCSQVEHHRLGFCATLPAQHKRPIFCAACLKSSQRGKEEARLLSRAQAASATIRPAQRGHPRVPSLLRQRNSNRHKAEHGKQRPRTIAPTSRDIPLQFFYLPCSSATDVRMSWSQYSGDAENRRNQVIEEVQGAHCVILDSVCMAHRRLRSLLSVRNKTL